MLKSELIRILQEIPGDGTVEVCDHSLLSAGIVDGAEMLGGVVTISFEQDATE